MIDGAHPAEHTIRNTFRKLNAPGAPRNVVAFSKWCHQNSREVGSVLRVLADAGIVRTDGRTGEFTILSNVIARAALQRSQVARKRELLRLERMQGYAYHKKCRRKYVMDYFGDTTFRNCAGCDNCSRARS
jgi:ATP-dependent DNA helicase RecQ